MVEFRTKLITLAGIATMFAGMAHAQITGCSVASSAVFVAAEGTTEQVADAVLSCPATPAASQLNLTVYLSPAVTVTSAVLGSGGGARSEAMAGQTASFAPGGSTGPNPVAPSTVPTAQVVAGVVSGSSITFSGIVIPAATAVSITITNIKINASQIATSAGVPTAVTETIFIGGTNVTPNVLGAANVAFAVNGLTGVNTKKGSDVTSTSVSSISICTGNTAFTIGAPALYVEFAEGFATAFKTGGSATANAALGSEFTANTYTGYGVTPATAPPANYTAPPSANTATSGTRIQIVFNNIPANVNIFMPLTFSIGAPATSTLTMTASATGAFSAVAGSTANGAPGGADNTHGPAVGTYALLTVSNGSATVIYEETLNNSAAVETYDIPVNIQANAAAVAAPQSAITATVSFAPIGASSNVPNFVSGSSTATKNGPAFNACATTLLFPFVTNQLGFDTGLAIANTSTDLLNGGTKSNAAAQSGTCSLTFFGASAPTAVTTPTVTTGTVYAAAASTLAPGFQGYMIANCNFLYGHGFAYVVYNLTQNNGAAMGYLANVINNDRNQSGTDAAIGNKNPESSGQ